MRADMLTKIDILKLTKVRNSFGELKDNWIVFKSMYASKEPLLGNEYYNANAVNSEVEIKFRSYYTAGVTNDMRIRDSEGTYTILSAINVKSLNRELLMYCKKVVE